MKNRFPHRMDASSFGQGFVAFNSYVANNAAGALRPLKPPIDWTCLARTIILCARNGVRSVENMREASFSVAFTLVNGVTVDYDDGDVIFSPNVTIPDMLAAPSPLK